MANGMKGSQELPPIVCLFLMDRDALRCVPVIPEKYPKSPHHARLWVGIRRAIGIDDFPSLFNILINDLLVCRCHCWAIDFFFALFGAWVAEPGGEGCGWFRLGCCRLPVSFRDMMAVCMSRASVVGRLGAGCSCQRARMHNIA